MMPNPGGGMMEQGGPNNPTGSMQRIQSLHQELQQEIHAFRQQRNDGGGVMNPMGPQGPNMMGQPGGQGQQQQRMVVPPQGQGRGGLRQV